MQMDNAAPSTLQLECMGVGGNLVDAAPIMPNGSDPPNGGVVIGVNFGACETSRALFKLSFDAQELSGTATELLQQGDLGLPVSKDLPVGFK